MHPATTFTLVSQQFSLFFYCLDGTLPDIATYSAFWSAIHLGLPVSNLGESLCRHASVFLSTLPVLPVV